LNDKDREKLGPYVGKVVSSTPLNDGTHEVVIKVESEAPMPDERDHICPLRLINAAPSAMPGDAFCLGSRCTLWETTPAPAQTYDARDKYVRQAPLPVTGICLLKKILLSKA
jgi:hypothetical protein